MFNFLKEFGIPGIIVGAITAAVFLYKRAKEYQVNKLHTTKDQLDAIVNLYDSDNNKNAFLVEQVFNYRFNFHIQYSAIQILLNMNNPTQSIQDYKLGKMHLKLNDDQSSFLYKGWVSNSNYRRRWKIVDVILYFIFAYSAGFVLFNIDWVYSNYGFETLVLTFPIIFVLLWAAYEFLKSGARIVSSEKIIDEISHNETHNKSSNLTGEKDSPSS